MNIVIAYVYRKINGLELDLVKGNNLSLNLILTH